MDQNELIIPDIASEDFDLARKQLARRRRLAEELLNTPFNQGVRAGNVFAASGADPGAFLSRAAGMINQHRIDAEENALSQREAQNTQRIVSELGKQGKVNQQYDPESNPGTGPLLNGEVPMTAEEDKARRFGLYGQGMNNPSLRSIIASQLGAEMQQPLKNELLDTKLAGAMEQQEARNRAMMQGIDARFENQKALRQIPTVHITNSGNSAADNMQKTINQYAGAATQVGVDRDGNPVYRLTKTGKLYGFDENGQPREHNGIIAPKPANAGNPTEAERGAAGYLGRMEESEKNLTDAKPLPFAQQKGMQVAPSLTNFTLSPDQQVTRQQQMDWVRAKLRKESGAVIGEKEMEDEIRTYFPQAGDKPEVLRQKAQSRMQAQEQMKSSAGRAKSTAAEKVAPTVVRTGTRNGVKVQQMSDGSIREVK